MKSTLLNCKSFVPPLMEAVRQYDEFATPPLKDILGERSSFNANEICETLQISATSPKIKKVFDPDAFISKIRLPKRQERQSKTCQ